ncbi:tyrosinase family oxidase copper chaperone [Streptomyces sp. JV176]|uniref:tyrosinase family oxidase copper chaperone n=1 Tax=Streptomyces sp. JV176 TaxID=858630 RepID=UPI002E7A44CA|nr:tyrosinase family oxidase copper chaperone [Streptomyces sp. JV176]MEE1798492.1 tyrosinase family oxidase copper chaperone [Streptomyces sp. JV176]
MSGGIPVPAGGPRVGGPHRSRRRFLRALFTLGMVAGTSAALAPVVRAGRGAASHVPSPPDGAATGGAALEESYRGRHIRVGPGAAGPATAIAAGAAVRAVPVPDIRIDGRPLQVMRRADGSYLSVVNHYESFATPLEAARAAVDDLGGAQLSPAGPVHGPHHGPDPHI